MSVVFPVVAVLEGPGVLKEIFGGVMRRGCPGLVLLLIAPYIGPSSCQLSLALVAVRPLVFP